MTIHLDPSSSVPDAPTPDLDTQGFINEVLNGSSSVPIIVDFWAPWCGPCKQLAPVLEKIVKAYKGKVRLVKVNIDENKQLAAQMRVQSIPAVYAFFGGRPIDGFMGVQPESAIKTFIDKLLHATGAEGGSSIDAALKQADDFFAQGDIDTAHEIYAAVLENDPENATAYAGMIKIALSANHLDEAEAMFSELPSKMASHKDISAVRAQFDLLKQSTVSSQHDSSQLAKQVEENPDDQQARFDYAMALFAQNQHEQAMDVLIDSIKRNREWNDEAARKQMLKFFEAWGVMHPMTVLGRRKLSAILFR